MYSLFIDAPVTWIGTWKPETKKVFTKSNPSQASYKVADYKSWFRKVMQGGPKEERFSNVTIEHDGTIGSVTFDYSFWGNGIKGNWVKESWALVKVNNTWKIASVVFSMDLEKINHQPATDDVHSEIKHTSIEQYLKAVMDTSRFQGVVLVAKGDSLLHKAAYGYFDVENTILNEVNTQFLIGSLTKSFTAVAIMCLVEEGKIDLRAPLSRYIPELKSSLAEGLTIHHLLKQQSGLASRFDDLTTFEVMDITPDELLEIVNSSSKQFKPGEKFDYSNVNYTLLAIVIERVTGMRYQDYLAERIFIPLNMKNTGMERLLNVPANRAEGYRLINGTFRRVHNVVSYALGAGDMYSTADDLLKWGRALQTHRILKPASTQLLFNGGTKDWGYYGYGFRIQPYSRADRDATPGTLIRHGGTMNGFTSNYHYYKEDDITVLILSNYRNTPIRKITYQVKECALGTGSLNRKNSLEE